MAAIRGASGVIGGTIHIHISKDKYTLGYGIEHLLVGFVADYSCGDNPDFLWERVVS